MQDPLVQKLQNQSLSASSEVLVTLPQPLDLKRGSRLGISREQGIHLLTHAPIYHSESVC